MKPGSQSPSGLNHQECFFFFRGWGSLPVGWLLLLLPFGFIQICLFVEVRPAVGSSAGKAAAFNCSLLWLMGEKEASWLVLHNGGFFVVVFFAQWTRTQRSTHVDACNYVTHN